MDHSMLTGILTARSFLGPGQNLWGVNLGDRHHEEAPAAAAGT